MTRTCRKCNTEYELSEENFYKDKTRKFGLSYICKECAIKKRKKQTLSQTEDDFERRRKRDRDKRKDDRFRLSQNFSRRVRYTINKNENRWFDIVGYSIDDLLKRMSETLPDGFSMNDYGSKLHIDHIIPITAYSFSSYEDEDFKKCWNLRNLRLLESSKNISKSNDFDISLVEEYNIFDLLPESFKEG